MFTSPNWFIDAGEVSDIVDAKLKPTQAKVAALEISVTKNVNTIKQLQTTVAAHKEDKTNPHAVTATQVEAAPLVHNHDSTYAKIDHSHTPVSIGAAEATHTHVYSDLTGVAASNHNHDNTYSKLDHTHTLESIDAAATSHTHAISDVDTLSDALTKSTSHMENYDNPHKTSDENLVKVLKFDFTDKNATQPFTVVRASKEWALDENDKFVEYPNNTLAYAFDKTDNRYGAQLFNTRTRLNSYYKTPVFEYANTVSKNINNAVSDTTSQTGDTITRLHFNDTANIDETVVKDNNYSSTLLLRTTDNVTVSAGTTDTFTLSIRIKHSTADNPDLKAMFWYKLGIGSETQIADMQLSSDWQTNTITFSVNNSGDTDQVLIVGFYISATEPVTHVCDLYYPADTFIDVDWFQIEKTEYATPLIMGTEGTQLTVLRTEPLYTGTDTDLITTTKQISVYAEYKKYYYGGRPWQVKTNPSVFRYYGTLDMKNRHRTRVEDNVTVLPELLTDTHYLTLPTDIPLGTVVRDVSLFDFVDNELCAAANGIVSDTKSSIVNVPWVADDKQFILSSNGQSVTYLCGYLYHLSIYTKLLDNEKLRELTQ